MFGNSNLAPSFISENVEAVSLGVFLKGSDYLTVPVSLLRLVACEVAPAS